MKEMAKSTKNGSTIVKNMPEIQERKFAGDDGFCGKVRGDRQRGTFRAFGKFLPTANNVDHPQRESTGTNVDALSAQDSPKVLEVGKLGLLDRSLKSPIRV
jgi:hypothetical protein